MATFDSAVYTAQTKYPLQRADQSNIQAKVFVARGSYDGDQTIAQNDKVNMFVLPAKARPVYWVIENEAFGSSVTVDIGTDSDADYWVAGEGVATAGQAAPTPINSHVGVNDETAVVLSFGGANPTDTAKIWVTCVYAIDW